MRSLTLFVVLLASVPLMGQTQQYLWGEVSLPEAALRDLPARAEALGIPSLIPTQTGPKLLVVENEAELLAAETYLIYDPPYFLLCVQTDSVRAILRGNQRAEMIIIGTEGIVSPPKGFFSLIQNLGLLPEGKTVELEARKIPPKLPRPPKGIRLDPVLWSLVKHPDWIGFARDYGLELSGIRVRVVAETKGELDQKFEPYIASSSDGLVELLIPIPLLPALGQDPAVLTVRPPYVPHPAGG